MTVHRLGSAAEQAVAAVRELSWFTQDAPIVLGYHPVARMNPYQALLYSDTFDEGIAAVPLERLADLDSLAVAATSVGAPAVFNLHWTNGIIGNAPSLDDAQERVAEFHMQLDGFRARGGRIVWTVHNVLPHRCPYPSAEASLRQGLADRADMLHIMASETVELTSPHYTLDPSKIVRIPHPSYLGAYPTWMSQRRARFELELGFDDLVWGFIGEVRQNKGLALLADALDEVVRRQPDGNHRLVMAGRHPDGDDTDTLRRLRRHPWVLSWPFRVQHDDMSTFVRATDVVILPYDQSLNSGMVHLASTLERPLIGPLSGGMVETLELAPGIGFEPGNADSLADAMLDARDLRSDDVRARALAFAESRSPAVISGAFSEAVRSIVD